MKKGWKTSTLSDTCEMYQPKTISGKEMVEDGAYPVYGANGVIGRYNQFNHEEPQLLITCRGATCGSVNISAPRSWVTGNAMVVRPKDGSIEMRFLEYFFRGGIDISKAITGAAQPQITRTNLAPLEICYPVSVAEQQRIVDILNEAFAGIAAAKANAEKNLQNARALFESHLQSVFTQKGKGWVEKPIAECFKVRSGDFLPAKAMVKSGEFDVYGGNGVNGRHDKKNMTGENIIIGRVGAKCGNVHFVEGDAWVTDNAVYISEYLCPFDLRFLTRLLRLKDLRSRANQMAQPVISYATIKDVSLEFPIPKLTQAKIVHSLDDFEEETQRLARLYERKLAALEALKKSLLHQAFSGEL